MTPAWKVLAYYSHGAGRAFGGMQKVAAATFMVTVQSPKHSVYDIYISISPFGWLSGVNVGIQQYVFQLHGVSEY